MEAAQDSAQPPLVVRQVLERIVGLVDAGLEEDVEVEAARDDHPQQVVGDGAEVIERIERVAEDLVEQALGGEERLLAGALDELQHVLFAGAIRVNGRRTERFAASSPPAAFRARAKRSGPEEKTRRRTEAIVPKPGGETGSMAIP